MSIPSRIRFLDRRGIILDEVKAPTTRSWLLNNVGDCSFTISRRSPKLVKDVVEFGNFVVVTNPNTKPWVGVLDLPRTWTKYGPRFTAYSSEILLSYYQDQDVDPETNRIKPATILEGKAGNIYQQMVERINNMDDTLIRVGDIFGGGADRQETLKSDYLSHVQSVAKRAGNDFDLTPSFGDQGTLVLKANWYEKKGRTVDLKLEEGVNIQAQDEIMTEQGQIINKVMGIGFAASDQSRYGNIQIDALSRLQYGMRCGQSTFTSVTDIATLTDNTVNLLKSGSWPRVTARVVCVKSELFKEWNEGDTAPLVLHSAGFLDDGTLGTKADVHIVGLQANDKDGTMEILVDEFIGDD